jgi:copper chaperone
MNTPQTYQLKVQGMTCQHCVKAVTAAIQAQDAQAEVAVDLPQGQAKVCTTLAEAKVRELIEEEGYMVA